MNKTTILFIQGAGEGAYAEDKKLAESLQNFLGSDYVVIYPAMPDEQNVPYDQWREHIQKELIKIEGQAILVGHSVGASVIAKFVNEVDIEQSLWGIFLIAAPFWGGDGWRYEGYKELEITKELNTQFLNDVPIFLYHAQDDEVVPFDHLALYAKLLPGATIRKLNKGGHQLNNDLTIVAEDIKNLQQ